MCSSSWGSPCRPLDGPWGAKRTSLWALDASGPRCSRCTNTCRSSGCRGLRSCCQKFTASVTSRAFQPLSWMVTSLRHRTEGDTDPRSGVGTGTARGGPGGGTSPTRSRVSRRDRAAPPPAPGPALLSSPQPHTSAATSAPGVDEGGAVGAVVADVQPLDGDPGAVAAREEALVSAERGPGDWLLEEAQHGLHQLAAGRQPLLHVEHQQMRGRLGLQEPADHLWGQERSQRGPSEHQASSEGAGPLRWWPGCERPAPCSVPLGQGQLPENPSCF